MSCMEGQRLRLRAATAEDAEARFSLGHCPDIVRMFGVSHADCKAMTREAAEAWALGQSLDPYVWIIEVGGRLTGEIKLHSINTADRRASMAIAIYDPMLDRVPGIGVAPALAVPSGQSRELISLRLAG